ncbi:MAG: hypothetical protein ABJA18_02470 [bacterium]
MDANTKLDLLKSEYLHIQGVIESFDSRVLSIKTWSVTTGLTGIGAAFSTHSKYVLLLATLSSLMFWYIEGRWKTFQYAYGFRASDIEYYFSGDNPDIVPMQIRHTWRGDLSLLRTMRQLHVALPHAFVVLTGAILYLLSVVRVLAL